MNENNKTEEILNARQASLSSEQKNVLWNRIQAEVLNPQPVPSPFLFNFKIKTPMAPIALAVLLMLGVGGTAAASNEARPGDLLFPVDRALEKAHLAIINNDEAKAKLHLAFAEERLNEIRSILNDDTTDTAATSTATSTINFEAEADVFTDITIVKVEINDRKTTFETTADTKEEVIAEIATRFALDAATVEAGLNFEIENRASRIQDLAKRKFSDDTNTRIDAAVDLIAELLGNENISGEARARILADLLLEFDAEDSDEPERENVKIDYQEKGDDSRLKIREGNERIEIREKDGETEIRIKSYDDDNHSDSNDSDDDKDDRGSDDNQTSNNSAFEAEADVFTDITIVKVEINDRKTTFEITADTRTEVIDEIVRRFSIERTTIDSALDFQIEDRASRTQATSTSDNNDDDSHSSDDDNDSVGDNSSDTSDDSDSRIRIEVKVEEGKAEVKLEYDGKQDEFETLYTTKAALITQLALRTGLTETVVNSNLDLEIKD